MTSKTGLEVYNERLNNILAVLSDPPVVSVNLDPSSAGTITNTIASGKVIKIGKGYYTTDMYYQASGGLIPTGNIQLTQQTGTDVSNYATASVRSGVVKTPTNSTALSSTSTTLSGSTLTVQASVTPSVTTAGWVSSGTAGTVKISGTVPTETKTASASGDITPTSGKLLSKVSVPAGSLSTNSATTNNVVPSGYTENTSIIVPTNGWLLIGAGWYPKTAISLDQILGGKADSGVTSIGAGYLRNGYKAYNVDGSLVTGSIVDWNPSTTYYTTTNTGYGVITANSFVNSSSAQYIKKGVIDSSVTNSITAPSVSVSGSATGFTASSSATSYYVTVSGSGTNGSVTSNATSSVTTAGWLTTDTTDTSSDTDTITPTITGSGSKVYIPAGSFTINGGGLSGGGLTKGSGTVSGSNVILSDTNTSGISVSGSGSVTRAAVTRAGINATKTAGYISAGTAFGLIADSTTIPLKIETSNTATKYITDITVPTNKTLQSTTLDAGAEITTLNMDENSGIAKLNAGGGSIFSLFRGYDYSGGPHLTINTIGDGLYETTVVVETITGYSSLSIGEIYGDGSAYIGGINMNAYTTVDCVCGTLQINNVESQSANDSMARVSISAIYDNAEANIAQNDGDINIESNDGVITIDSHNTGGTLNITSLNSVSYIDTCDDSSELYINYLHEDAYVNFIENHANFDIDNNIGSISNAYNDGSCYISVNCGSVDVDDNSGSVWVRNGSSVSINNYSRTEVNIQDGSTIKLTYEDPNGDDSGDVLDFATINGFAITVGETQVTDANGNLILSGGEPIPDSQIISLVNSIF